jgi:hypothetical protein
MTAKRLEVLHELVPSVTTFAFLTDPGNKTLVPPETKIIQAAADSLDFKLVYVSAHTPDEFDSAYETATRGGAGAIIPGSDILFGGPSLQLIAADHRLPTIYWDELPVKAGGLISYGGDLDEALGLLGTYAGRILKGEKMRAELPARLAAGPRVIKRNRGNGGQGVWKVESLSGPRSRPMVRVLAATNDASEEVALDEFLERCVEYFQDGCVIDQPFQIRLSEGVVRCYMAGDRCAGFGHHKVKALVDAPAARTDSGR